MDKKNLEKQKEKLQEQKKKLEKRLNVFADKNKKVKHDWVTRYPKLGSGNLEEEADRVEEYGNLLSVSYSLELELKKVNEAIKKTKGKKYGICEKCKKAISNKRLEVYPQAKYCIKCQS